MRKTNGLLAKSQTIDWKNARSILSFILLLASLIIAGSVDAAMPAPAKQPILKQMLKHALFSYSKADYDTLENLAFTDGYEYGLTKAERILKVNCKVDQAIKMLKGILDWSDRIGSDEISEIEDIIKILTK